MDHPVMEAEWAESTPDEDHVTRYWRVGNVVLGRDNSRCTITRITVQQDLPGLHCNMRRVCVWAGDTLVVEAPMHSLMAVGYPLPPATPSQEATT